MLVGSSLEYAGRSDAKRSLCSMGEYQCDLDNNLFMNQTEDKRSSSSYPVKKSRSVKYGEQAIYGESIQPLGMKEITEKSLSRGGSKYTY